MTFNRTTNNVVLYHKNCLDGMCAAFLMHHFFLDHAEQAELIAVNYGNPMPDVTGKSVYIVDFSYNRETIEVARKQAKSITMLDHHLTAAEEWGGYDVVCLEADSESCSVDIELIESKSGAGIVYDYVCKYSDDLSKSKLDNVRVRQVVAAVQDRDLWKFKLHDTKAITEALAFIPKTIKAWDEFVLNSSDYEYKCSVTEGHAFLKLKENMAQSYAKVHQMVSFQGTVVPMVNVASNFASRVGEILCEGNHYSLMYVISTTGIICSLRGDVNSVIDVSAIAKKFGGGGHQHAAGFMLRHEQLSDLLRGKL